MYIRQSSNPQIHRRTTSSPSNVRWHVVNANHPRVGLLRSLRISLPDAKTHSLYLNWNQTLSLSLSLSLSLLLLHACAHIANPRNPGPSPRSAAIYPHTRARALVSRNFRVLLSRNTAAARRTDGWARVVVPSRIYIYIRARDRCGCPDWAVDICESERERENYIP